VVTLNDDEIAVPSTPMAVMTREYDVFIFRFANIALFPERPLS
jgi:hypothetical protein